MTYRLKLIAAVYKLEASSGNDKEQSIKTALLMLLFFYLKNSSMLCKIKYITKVMTND